jgi:hypothetical protein
MSPEVSEQETSLITAKTPLQSFPVGSLFFTHGERAGQEVPLTRDTFFIGRSKNNNLPLNDKSVSRKHAVINMLEGEYILSDLNSLKGSYVNGRKIEEVTLKPGDIINIGENRMQFRLVTPSGTWIAPGKRNALWYFLIVLVMGAMIGVGAWFFTQEFNETKVPDQTLTQIEEHYDKGIEYFNREHNLDAARKEWKKILELDPEKKTNYATKAEKLLKNTEKKVESE